MKKERPILFNTEMVRAVESGIKSQTRRIAKTQPTKGLHLHVSKALVLDGTERETWIYSHKDGLHCQEVTCPYGSVGDLLWVREKWRPLIDCRTGIEVRPDYYAESPEGFHKMYPSKWKPSIHMKKIHTRIWLEITNVRLEQLQTITEADAIAEGITRYESEMEGVETDWLSAKYGFEILWKEIYGDFCWGLSPWVWVVEFKRIEKPNTL